MISMATGMLNGIVGGTIIAIYHSGGLFQSTVLGILIGVLIGFITGLPFGILAVTDGVLSGLMGGMMGAMLGEMMPSQNIDQLIKILFLLFIAVHLFMIYLILYDVREKETNMMVKLFKNPLFAGGFLICSVYLLNLTGPVMERETGSAEHQHNQETISKDKAKSSLTLEIKAMDFSYKPRIIAFKKGEEYELTLKNEGKAEHDINIVSAEEFNKNNTDNLYENYYFHLHVQAGQYATAKLNSLPIGNYIFYCTVPGHKEAGMVGNIEVL